MILSVDVRGGDDIDIYDTMWKRCNSTVNINISRKDPHKAFCFGVIIVILVVSK